MAGLARGLGGAQRLGFALARRHARSLGAAWWGLGTGASVAKSRARDRGVKGLIP